MTVSLQTEAPADGDAVIHERIAELLRRGEIGAANAIPAADVLARDLDADAASVRRALAELESEGALWRDAEPAGPDRERSHHPAFEPMQIIEARLCVEPVLASLCAQRATSGEVEALKDLLARAEDDPDNDTWDVSLHQTIAFHARSAVLHAAFVVIEDARASPSWQVALKRARTAEHRAMYRDQHMAIVDAVCQRDPAAAGEAMSAHVDLLKRHMAFALGPR